MNIKSIKKINATTSTVSATASMYLIMRPRKAEEEAERVEESEV